MRSNVIYAAEQTKSNRLIKKLNFILKTREVNGAVMRMTCRS